MKFFTPLLLGCIYLGDIAELIHARALPSTPQLSRRAGPERPVTRVTFAGRLDPGLDLTRDRYLEGPFHSFLLFGSTAQDPALRVEVVVPLIANRPRGLAIAITQLPRGQPEPTPDEDVPGLLRHFRAGSSSLTNDEIFNPNLAADSLMASVWAKNAMDKEHKDTFVLGDVQFGASHALVGTLASLLQLKQYDALQGEESLFFAGVSWADARRQPRGGTRGGYILHKDGLAPIDYLFYQAAALSSNAPSAAAQPGTAAIRAVYELDKSNPLEYKARRVTQPWKDRFERPDPNTPQETITLSRDPHLTSDVLPWADVGSLSDDPGEQNPKEALQARMKTPEWQELDRYWKAREEARWSNG